MFNTPHAVWGGTEKSQAAAGCLAAENTGARREPLPVPVRQEDTKGGMGRLCADSAALRSAV